MNRWNRILALAATLAATTALAQGYPNKPVKVIVPYPPGGPTDIVARSVAQKLSEQTGQQFVVDNRAGAGGNIGAEAVKNSPADGYTLLVATTAHAINKTLFPKLNYDLVKDFIPVSQLTAGPLVIVANPKFAPSNVKELIAAAKAKPGEVNFASSGPGQSTHLSAELFSTMAGVKMTHVPYKGSAPALTDTMGGQTSIFFDTMLSAMPHVRGGKLKAIAVTSAQRSPAAPDIPTVAESGLPGYEAIAWNGLLAPAGTPREVVAKLNAEMKKALELPDIKERFAAQGFAAAYSTSDAYAKFINAEVDKWAKVVKVSGATID